jgi:two-component system, NtrC family, sensor kinase
MLKLTGITARTTLLAWTVTLATLGIFVVIIIPEQKRDLRIGLESQATGVAGALQGEVAGAAVSEDYSSVVDHALQVMAGDKTVDFLVITKNDGYAVVVERDSWRVIPNIDGFWHPIVRTPTGNIERLPLFEKRVFHFAVPFDYSGLQWGWIHVGLSLESYDRSVRQVYLRTGILSVVCILLSLVASRFYAKRFVEPILRLRAVVEQVAGGDLMARAHIDSQDEIEQLADAFNNMADAVLHRNRIVESVRFTAQSLQGATQWSEVIDQILSKIGQSASASRVLVAESHLSLENVALGSIRFEWTAPDIPGWRDSFQNRDLAKEGLKKTDDRLALGEMIIVHGQDRAWQVARPMPPLSELIAPILVGSILWGTLVVQDCERDREWHEVERDSVRAVVEMLGATIVRQNALQALFEAKTELENRVIARTRELQEQMGAKDRANAELEEAQKRLIELSRLSGMAEVATSVLHNVGNVLNSINVSSTLIADRLRASRVSQLQDLARLLREHETNLGDFLLRDPSGQRILPYLEKVSQHLVQERNELCIELEGLVQHVAHVKDIVSMQQTYARTSGVLEKIAFHTLIEDALRITRAEMDRHGVVLHKDIEKVPTMTTDRNKILQILLNLLRNAKDAVKASPTLPREVTVRLRSIDEDRLRLQVSDNGAGIAPENLSRVFSHGFTTKKDGHGFGLHFGALTARQLGGSLHAESDGLGRGATLTLELPINNTNMNDTSSDQGRRTP